MNDGLTSVTSEKVPADLDWSEIQSIASRYGCTVELGPKCVVIVREPPIVCAKSCAKYLDAVFSELNKSETK